jgi:uncharacterized protein YqfA (UPF0365 family)
MGMCCMDEGYLFTASEDCTAHEFWVAKGPLNTAPPIKVSAGPRYTPRQQEEPPATVHRSLHHTRAHHSPMRRVDPSLHLKAGSAKKHLSVEEANSMLSTELHAALEREAALKDMIQEGRAAPPPRTRPQADRDQKAEFEEMRAKQKQMEEYNRVLEAKLRKLEAHNDAHRQ